MQLDSMVKGWSAGRFRSRVPSVSVQRPDQSPKPPSCSKTPVDLYHRWQKYFSFLIKWVSLAFPLCCRNLNISCSDDSAILAYLNDSKVREALHIPAFVQEWATCSAEVYMPYGRIYRDLSPQYLQLLQNKVSVYYYLLLKVGCFNSDLSKFYKLHRLLMF